MITKFLRWLRWQNLSIFTIFTMAWRSVSLLDATKSPFMLVLPVAAPHQYQKWQVEDFAYM